MDLRAQLQNKRAELQKYHDQLTEQIAGYRARIESVDRLLASMTAEQEVIVLSLIDIGVLEEERPF